jgi:ankyrin repeat protein
MKLIFFKPQSSVLLCFLNEPGVKINIQDSQGRTPLHYAIMYGCVANAQHLISKNAKLDVST